MSTKYKFRDQDKGIISKLLITKNSRSLLHDGGFNKKAIISCVSLFLLKTAFYSYNTLNLTSIEIMKTNRLNPRIIGLFNKPHKLLNAFSV